jgi:hypothetical protein
MIAAVPKLLAACQAVVANWEQGDLAQAARFCQDALQTAMPDLPAAQEQGVIQPSTVQPRKVRRAEYYRLWGGDSGTWDTDFIGIPAGTPDDMVDKAIREAAAKIEWRDEPPVIVGCYNDGSDQEEDDDSTDAGVQRPTTRDAHEQTITDLVTKAEAAGLRAEDFDETVHELASGIAADINNAGLEDQLRYLIAEWGGEAAGREIDRLAEERKNDATARRNK